MKKLSINMRKISDVMKGFDENKQKKLIVTLGSIAMLAFSLIPFIFMVITSFSKQANYLSKQASFHFTWLNYHLILTDKTLHFFDYLRNSAIVSSISAIVCVMIAGLAAYAITRLNFPGKIFILLFILAISMFPQLSLISYLFKFMNVFNWVNTYQALVLPYIAWILPLSLWILVSYFSQIPRDLDEAALVDGGNRWQIFFNIILPVAAPGLLSTALLAFIFAFNEFLFALMLTTDYHARTIPVGIALFQGLHGEIPWGNIMAAAALTTLPVIILTIMFQRKIIEGLTQGAVKG